MRCIGKGAESAVMFCGIMNLPPPPTKFTKFNNNLLQAARETCEESMAEAVHEAIEENEGGRDIAVAVDGSWQKRGFSSKNGVVTVTSVDTGKLIEVKRLFSGLVAISLHFVCDIIFKVSKCGKEDEDFTFLPVWLYNFIRSLGYNNPSSLERQTILDSWITTLTNG
ncbi:uncharacterized protein NPIL_617801 [Nephila pilipes]|uniref:Mutator-like transposase domain-containing protein n=1 Tax=Nephila pilipes TaxID=299642 RepID=A0A8X6PKH6_NEPPI|nr:uncharacterized protein NPIL_617801 [Nephila pilipes]